MDASPNGWRPVDGPGAHGQNGFRSDEARRVSFVFLFALFLRRARCPLVVARERTTGAPSLDSRQRPKPRQKKGEATRGGRLFAFWGSRSRDTVASRNAMSQSTAAQTVPPSEAAYTFGDNDLA